MAWAKDQSSGERDFVKGVVELVRRMRMAGTVGVLLGLGKFNRTGGQSLSGVAHRGDRIGQARMEARR